MTSVATAYGLEFEYPPLDNAVGACLRDHGEFARPELEFIQACHDGALIDVGANIGAICLPFASARPQSEVVAVEAQPSIAAMLRNNVARNRLSNVRIVEAVAGEADGWFAVPLVDLDQPTNVGAATLYAQAPSARDTPMVTLDAIAPAGVGFVKVDVEGFEPRVLAGAAVLLNEVRPCWLVEVNKRNPEATEQVRQTLLAARYQLHWFFSPFITPAVGANHRALRGDFAFFASDGEPPWPMCRVADAWPTGLKDLPYLAAYHL